MREFIYIIDDKYHDFIVQDYLKQVHGYSTRIINKVKQDKSSIMLNGKHVRVVDKVKCNDILYIKLNDIMHIKSNHDLFAKILYNDSDIIIYDKPYNMPIHPSKSHQSDTLANVFANYCEYSREECIFRPLNRLDTDTSGICIIAKNQLAAVNLSKGILKKYKAVICGNINNHQGTIDLPIRRVNEILIKREVGIDGKRSLTEYEVISRGNNYDLLNIILRTGRTHQIRVHFSYIGYPLAGDKLYGGDTCFIQRHALHCYNVSFKHPITKSYMEITSELPKDINNLLQLTNIK